MQTNPAFVDSLAVAGISGTMQQEMLGTRAVGDCRGKTGTLSDVANLVGYCTARNGDTLAFAFLLNDLVERGLGPQMEDQMGVALANYDGPPLMQTAGSDQARRSRRPPSVRRVRPHRSRRTPSRSACASFEPGLSPATTYDGSLGDRPGDLSAAALNQLGRLLAGEVRQRAGEHERHPGERTLSGRRARFLERADPEPRRSSISSRICGICELRVDRSVAIFSPIPGVCSICSGVGGEQRINRAELLGEVAPGDRPTSSMPSANSTRPNGWRFGCLDRVDELPRRDRAEAALLGDLLGAPAGRSHRPSAPSRGP